MPLHLPPLTRRQFVRHSLLGAGALLSPRLLGAAGGVDPDFWALLSDTHIAADRTKLAREINMADHLGKVVAEVLAESRRPAAALVNGDLAYNTGEAADYATFAGLVAPLRAAGLPLHLGLGNHDHRERFWAALAGDPAAVRPLVDRQASIVPAGRANWFILDSLDRTNSTPGVLGSAQLAWLAAALDAHAGKPALVMVHHNPNPPDKKNVLVDTDEFFAVLRPRRHVKAYLFGHSHRWSVTQDPSGLHLVNLPATAYVFEKSQPAGWVRARLSNQGMRLELRSLDRAHPDHGQVVNLTWRT